MLKTSNGFSFGCLALLGAVALSAPQPLLAKSSFREALDEHFAAVVDRDLDGLVGTLTTGNDLTLILPNGKRTTAKSEFVDFHKQWFADKGWTMKFEVVSIFENRSVAVASVRTRYTEPDSAKPYWSESWLTLSFRREKGSWRLFYDQNTRIRSSDAVPPP